MLINLLYNSQPLVVHAHGSHSHKPHWQPIKEKFFSSPHQYIGQIKDLTILTCNNGHEAMGLLEKSLDHLGIPYMVRGQGIFPWINSKHKPKVILEATQEIETKYILYADSRDAIFLGNPQIILEKFEHEFSGEMVFSADRFNWPTIKEFQLFEDSIPEATNSEFRYLNGGIWIGKTEFCREFFKAVVMTEPATEAPDSEQGILKKLFKNYYPKVQLDYQCKMFQNIGFVGAPIFEIV